MSDKNKVQNEEKDMIQKRVGISNDKVMVIRSPEPLANEMLKIKKLYIICIVCIAVGALIQPLLAVGILGLMLVYTIDYHAVRVKKKVLRTKKFKFVEGVDSNNIFQTMQPIFTSKYKMLVEKEEGNMTLTHDDYIYDIIINDDNTFTIWWRMALGKAFFSFNNYKSYRKILAAMGIISYEIQSAYQIQ